MAKPPSAKSAGGGEELRPVSAGRFRCNVNFGGVDPGEARNGLPLFRRMLGIVKRIFTAISGFRGDRELAMRSALTK